MYTRISPRAETDREQEEKDMSFDVLQEKILEKRNPTVAGLDPRP